MARICCPKGHYHDVADAPGTTRTVNGITVKLRSVADIIQVRPEDRCGWFEPGDGIPSWPERPMAGMHDNVTLLVCDAINAGKEEEIAEDLEPAIALPDD